MPGLRFWIIWHFPWFTHPHHSFISLGTTLDCKPRFFPHPLPSLLFCFLDGFLRKETMIPSDRKLSFSFFLPFSVLLSASRKRCPHLRSGRAMSVHFFLSLLLLLSGLSKPNSCCVVLAKLEHASKTGVAFNLRQASCFYLLSARITSLGHSTQHLRLPSVPPVPPGDWCT